MAFGRPARPLDTEVNITSLVDILFNVLIFLALTTSFASRSGIDLKLPESTQSHEVESSAALEIELASDGALYFEGERIAPESLGARLREVADKEKPVVLLADEEARHGKVIQVMDAIRSAGLTRLAIQTRQASAPQGSIPPE